MELSEDLIFFWLYSKAAIPWLFRDKKKKREGEKHQREDFCQRSFELDIGFGQRRWRFFFFFLCSTVSSTTSVSSSTHPSIHPSIYPSLPVKASFPIPSLIYPSLYIMCLSSISVSIYSQGQMFTRTRNGNAHHGRFQWPLQLFFFCDRVNGTHTCLIIKKNHKLSCFINL